jgi:hypothetical protein
MVTSSSLHCTFRPMIAGVLGSVEETKLVRMLLDGYDTAVRPSKLFRDPINVTVGIAVNQFRDLVSNT